MDGLSAPVNRPKAARLAALVRAGLPYLFVPATTDLLDAGLALHAARPDKGWSLTDCVSFHVMHDRGLTRALAYDHHFAQAGFEPLLQREP
jgi:predicted nucleic acid-binding protein